MGHNVSSALADALRLSVRKLSRASEQKYVILECCTCFDEIITLKINKELD